MKSLLAAVLLVAPSSALAGGVWELRLEGGAARAYGHAAPPYGPSATLAGAGMAYSIAPGARIGEDVGIHFEYDRLSMPQPSVELRGVRRTLARRVVSLHALGLGASTLVSNASLSLIASPLFVVGSTEADNNESASASGVGPGLRVSFGRVWRTGQHLAVGPTVSVLAAWLGEGNGDVSVLWAAGSLNLAFVIR